MIVTPETLAALVFECALKVVNSDCRLDLEISVDDISLERPKNREHGDWATSIALRKGSSWGGGPREFALQIAQELKSQNQIEHVEVAGPGFINIQLKAASMASLVPKIIEEGPNFGSSSQYLGIAINLEFVSANPTGPIHMGGTRWAAVGDSLARILKFQGAEVTSEYYFNDHGAQIDRFARSLVAAHLGLPAPEDGYGGAYIQDIARRVEQASGCDLSIFTGEDLQEVFRSVGVDLMFTDIKKNLLEFGVHFDVYFHENSLHSSGAVQKAIEVLNGKGHIFESEGALWLRTTDFGDDKDRVVVKSDGEYAYIAADLAYYLDKRERGFDRNIIMLGADHHGYVARMMAMCAAFGDVPGQNLEILIGQMVNLLRNGEPVRMSKRAGTIVTLDDLVDAVGVDAGRYALIRSSSDSQLDIDLDLLGKKTNDNPVFYVQYAHARTCAVQRNAASVGVVREFGFEPALLQHETETELLGLLQEFPRVVAHSAESRSPHRIARYLEELASYYHRWYDKCRVIPLPNEPISTLNSTRLWLNDATRQVLSNGLQLVGVSAPERM